MSYWLKRTLKLLFLIFSALLLGLALLIVVGIYGFVTTPT